MQVGGVKNTTVECITTIDEAINEYKGVQVYINKILCVPKIKKYTNTKTMSSFTSKLK